MQKPATGLTTIEAENALALSVVETRTVDPGIVAREKIQALKKGGLLEFVEKRRPAEGMAAEKGTASLNERNNMDSPHLPAS